MSGILRWLRKNKYQAHMLAFLLMIIPAAILYSSAREGWTVLTWALIATVMLGNLIALWVK